VKRLPFCRWAAALMGKVRRDQTRPQRQATLEVDLEMKVLPGEQQVAVRLLVHPG